MIPPELIKQVGEIADWFLALPEKLVGAVMGSQEVFYENRERIRKLKELAILHEAGTDLSFLVVFKGNVYVWINRLQAQERVEEVEYVRNIFNNVVERLDSMLEKLRKSPLSSLELMVEISKKIGEARATYAALAALPDSAILEDRQLIDIVDAMQRMEQDGEFLIRLVDDHRKKLGEDTK